MHRRGFLGNLLATAVAGLGSAELGGGVVRRLFRRNDEKGRRPLRPPGALPEAEFLGRCIRCLRCADACPNNAIVPLDDTHGIERRGTPHIRPRRQACMLCQGQPGSELRCTEACPSGALRPVKKDPASIRENVSMGVAELDLALCYSYNQWSCGACYRACPLPGVAMTLGLWERPEVRADACLGCGLCERACIRYPQAIRVRPRGEA